MNRDSWEIKKLGDFFDITSSKRVFQSEWKTEGIPFYRAREIVKLAQFGFVNNELFISEEMYKEYAEKYGYPKEGDIMVTGVGTLGICYVVKANDKFYFKDGNIIWLRRKNNINSQYIEYAFKSNYLRKQIDNSAGATVGTYTIDKAKKTKIPVPSSSIQQQIVKELDTLSDIIAKKKEQLTELDKLAQATFYDMFGDPVENEKEWEIKKLVDACSKITDGTHASPKFLEQGIPFLFVSNIQNNELNFNTQKYISTEEYEKLTRSTKIDQWDLLYTSVGSYGNPAIIKTTQKFCFQRHIAHLKPKHEIINVVFFHAVMLTEYVKHQANKLAIGVAQKTLNLSAIKKITIPIPPLSFQTQFAKKIEAIEQQKALINQSITDTQLLFDYTMDKYFN